MDRERAMIPVQVALIDVPHRDVVVSVAIPDRRGDPDAGGRAA
jgi:hypothetical protein